ncbi:MAG: chorismate synthase [Bacteroidales bacterium]|jgi:chorismate synthase|nr:chorismate synthase [Bacteroidales bacterium]
MNTFGHIFRFTSFGESHGSALGGVIDGMPAGIFVDMEFIKSELRRRATGGVILGDSVNVDDGRTDDAGVGNGASGYVDCSCGISAGNGCTNEANAGGGTDDSKRCGSIAGSAYSSSRKESDTVEILSGVFNGCTLGTPVSFIIRNEDTRSEDYAELQHLFRPAHADDTYFHKYGVRDYRGGGRASARETAVRVVVGAFAKLLLRQYEVSAATGTTTKNAAAVIGTASATNTVNTLDCFASLAMTECGTFDTSKDILAKQGVNVAMTECGTFANSITIEAKIVEIGGIKVSSTSTAQYINALEQARTQGDSVGGIIECIVKNVPRNLGEPLYDKLSARLAYAMMSIPASRSFEIGKGIEATKMRGSQHNDNWRTDGTTENNYAGGIRGGISTGEDIILRVGFKPIPSIAKKQTLLSDTGELVPHSIKGRHDITCVFRALPIVEAMTAITLADFILLKSAQPSF